MIIATATHEEAPARPRQYDGEVSFRGFGDRAERKHRQIIAAIECCETAQEVDDTLTEHGLILDALFLDYPEYADAINAAADDHKAILAAGSAPTPNKNSDNVLGKAF